METNEGQMVDVPLTDHERRWIDVATRGFSLPDPTSVERISDPNPLSNCHIFGLTSGDERFALKVYPMGWWPDRLYRAHATAEFLNEHGFPAPRPLRTGTGERILFLGENPAICTTWLAGRSIWDPLTREWSREPNRTECLRSAMVSLATFHGLMVNIPLEATRVREFPPIDWFSKRLDEAIAMGADGGKNKNLGSLSELLGQNAFPEPASTQHVLIDCHPGQFLFSGTVVTGVVDFDHVAMACPVRDLSKFFATDASTLSGAADLLSRYLPRRPLSQQERKNLPAGILRYILTSAAQRIHKTLSDGLPVEPDCGALCSAVTAFRETLPELKAVLEIQDAPGIPTDLEIA